jgi:hypothetical protein
MTVTTQPGPPTVDSERERALKRIQGRRDLFSHLITYLVVNASLIAVWAMSGGGYFWPGWVLACWAAGLVLHAWDVFWRRPITDAEIDAELHRHR